MGKRLSQLVNPAGVDFHSDWIILTGGVDDGAGFDLCDIIADGTEDLRILHKVHCRLLP